MANKKVRFIAGQSNVYVVRFKDKNGNYLIPSEKMKILGEPNENGEYELIDKEYFQNNPGQNKGPKGDKGDIGATGPKGDKGDQGIQGPKGDKGDIGATGPQGNQGPSGATGPRGAAGPSGATGPKGDKGDTGATGPKGDKGDKGDAGSGSAFNGGIVPGITTFNSTVEVKGHLWKDSPNNDEKLFTSQNDLNRVPNKRELDYYVAHKIGQHQFEDITANYNTRDFNNDIGKIVRISYNSWQLVGEIRDWKNHRPDFGFREKRNWKGVHGTTHNDKSHEHDREALWTWNNVSWTGYSYSNMTINSKIKVWMANGQRWTSNSSYNITKFEIMSLQTLPTILKTGGIIEKEGMSLELQKALDSEKVVKDFVNNWHKPLKMDRVGVYKDLGGANTSNAELQSDWAGFAGDNNEYIILREIIRHTPFSKINGTEQYGLVEGNWLIDHLKAGQNLGSDFRPLAGVTKINVRKTWVQVQVLFYKDDNNIWIDNYNTQNENFDQNITKLSAATLVMAKEYFTWIEDAPVITKDTPILSYENKYLGRHEEFKEEFDYHYNQSSFKENITFYKISSKGIEGGNLSKYDRKSSDAGAFIEPKGVEKVESNLPNREIQYNKITGILTLQTGIYYIEWNQLLYDVNVNGLIEQKMEFLKIGASSAAVENTDYHISDDSKPSLGYYNPGSGGANINQNIKVHATIKVLVDWIRVKLSFKQPDSARTSGFGHKQSGLKDYEQNWIYVEKLDSGAERD